ncbi:MFS transporter [Streptomyces sp. NPDC127108]|uniref:MFS transporter n=1 Tax=Streptomyces sp. NPDC127108 TaxID=3345361 RepID=UPI0036304A93
MTTTRKGSLTGRRHDGIRYRWQALVVLTVAQFMLMIDDMVVNVALPTIRTDLGTDTPPLAWVVNGYLVTYGGFLLLGGRLGDWLGHRRVLATGLALFATASLASGLAPSAGIVIGARVAQGLGAALASPTALALIITTFTDPAERAKARRRWASGPR